MNLHNLTQLGYVQLRHRGVVVITTSQLHSTKPELRFCKDSNPARGVSEIRDGEDLWRWSRLEIRLNAFRWLTIPQKQFIIITYYHRLVALQVNICVSERRFFNLVSVIPIRLNFTLIFAKRVCRSSKLREMDDIFIWRMFVSLNSSPEKLLFNSCTWK